MKNILFSGLLTFTLILLSGCPVSTSFPLQNEEKGTVNDKLVGTWSNDSSNAEVKKVEISLSADNKYLVKVLEEGIDYTPATDSYKAWLTKISGKTFITLKEIEAGSDTNTYYLYQIDIGSESFITREVNLTDAGSIVSVDSYKKEVETSLKKEGCLSGEITWKRATKD